MKFILATADWAFKSSTVDSTWFVPRNQLSITWSEKTRSANNLAPLGQNKLPSSGQFESIFQSLDRLTGHIKLIVMAIKLDFMGDTHSLAKSPANRGQRECLSNIFWMNYKFLLTMWWCDKRQDLVLLLLPVFLICHGKTPAQLLRPSSLLLLITTTISPSPAELREW